MLNFKKCNTQFEVSPESITATRFINNRLTMLTVNYDGTALEMAQRVNTLLGLSDAMFESFDSIRRSEGV